MSKKSLPIASRRILESLLSYGIKAPDAAELAPHVLIRTIRNALGMTQAQLARRAELPQSHLAKIETGKVDVQLSTLRKILKAMFCEMVLVPKFQKTPKKAIAERIKEAARQRGLTRSEEKRLASRRSSEIWEEPPSRAEMPLRIVDKEDPRADLQFWLAKSAQERIDAVEFLRRQCFLVTGRHAFPRLERSIQMRERRS